jgi:hypothetical protein
MKVFFFFLKKKKRHYHGNLYVFNSFNNSKKNWYTLRRKTCLNSRDFSSRQLWEDLIYIYNIKSKIYTVYIYIYAHYAVRLYSFKN